MAKNGPKGVFIEPVAAEARLNYPNAAIIRPTPYNGGAIVFGTTDDAIGHPSTRGSDGEY